MSQASYGADALQQYIRQRMMDEIAAEERQRRATNDDREFGLREKELAQHQADREQERQDRLAAGQAAGADRDETRMNALAGNIVQETSPGTSIDKPMAGFLRLAGRGNLVKENPDYAFPPMLDTGAERETNIGDQPGDVYQGTASQQRQIRTDESAADNQRRTDARLSAQGAETARHNQAMENKPTTPPNDRLVQTMNDQGQPVWTPESQAAGKPAAQAPRAVTGAERGVLAYYNRAKQASDDIQPLEDTIAQSGLGAQLQLQHAPNMLQTQEQQAYRQAQRAFTEARLRKESGAAIPPAEYENDAKTYFAQPGDDPKTIDQKRRGRQTVLDGLKFSAGRAYDEFYGEAAGKPAMPGKSVIKSITVVP
jgi:hypothetical protein